jgi:hypothetical protein
LEPPVRTFWQILRTQVHEKVRDGCIIDEAALSFAIAGVDDLFEEIRALFERRHERHGRYAAAGAPRRGSWIGIYEYTP